MTDQTKKKGPPRPRRSPLPAPTGNLEETAAAPTPKERDRLDAGDQFFRGLFMDAPIPCQALDREGRFLEVNHSFCRVMGYERDEIIGRSFGEILHPDWIAHFNEFFPRLQALGEVLGTECELVRKDSSTLIASFQGKVIRDPQGRFLRSQCAFQDITERRRIDEALRQSKSQLQSIFRAAPVGIGVVAGRVLCQVNDRICAMTGYAAEELLNRDARLLYPTTEEYLAVGREKYEQIGRQGTGTVETRWRRKDGRVIDVLLGSSPIDPADPSAGVTFTALDITEQKQAEKALRQSKRKAKSARKLLELVLDTIPVRLFWKDRDSVYLGCNRLFAEDAGRRHPAELIGADDFSMPWREQAPIYRQADQAVIRSGQAKLHYEEEQTTPEEGKRIWLSTSKVPLRDDHDRIIGVLGAYEDITQRKWAEEELLKAQKLDSLGVLAGGIAHDFNNILMTILGNITFAKALIAPEDKAQERLTLAEDATMRAKDLTQQFLTFAKGGVPIKKPLFLPQIIRMNARFALSGISSTCIYDLPADLWPIDADEGQVGQVITNLLLNADQAMPEGGEIEVRCENLVLAGSHSLPLSDGRYLRLTVRDHGTGVPEELLGRIFDPYFTTKKTGRGLGLTSAFAIIRKHGGHITVAPAEGGGTLFSVYLPASSCQAAGPEAEPGPWIGSGRLLVMDDDESVLRVVESMLERLGYTVDLASDGKEATRKYAEALQAHQRYEAVIIDLTVPGGMGGEAAARALLALDPGARLIVSSGYCNDPVMADPARYGFQGVIDKPYTIGSLGALLRQVLAG